MSERVTLQDNTTLDMLDPVSIRRYCRKQLAINVEPTAPQLQRIKMLNELADELEQKAPPKTETPTQTPEQHDQEGLAASMELMRRLGQVK